VAGSENFRSDVELSQSLLAVSRHDDSRKCLLLLGAILDTPELADRLMTVLRPDMARDKAPQSSNGSK